MRVLKTIVMGWSVSALLAGNIAVPSQAYALAPPSEVQERPSEAQAKARAVDLANFEEVHTGVIAVGTQVYEIVESPLRFWLAPSPTRDTIPQQKENVKLVRSSEDGAMKVLKLTEAQEVSLLTGLNSQFIVKASVVEDNGLYFIIAMPFVGDHSRAGPEDPHSFHVHMASLNTRGRIAAWRKILSAVQHLHEKGFAYGDGFERHIRFDGRGNPVLLDVGNAAPIERRNVWEDITRLTALIEESLPAMGLDRWTADSWAVAEDSRAWMRKFREDVEEQFEEYATEYWRRSAAPTAVFLYMLGHPSLQPKDTSMLYFLEERGLLDMRLSHFLQGWEGVADTLRGEVDKLHWIAGWMQGNFPHFEDMDAEEVVRGAQGVITDPELPQALRETLFSKRTYIPAGTVARAAYFLDASFPLLRQKMQRIVDANLRKPLWDGRRFLRLFADRLIDDYLLKKKYGKRVMVGFLMTGADLLQRLVEARARQRGLSTEDFRSFFINRPIMGWESKEDILRYLLGEGVGDYDHVVWIDAGFEGTVIEFLHDLTKEAGMEALKTTGRLLSRFYTRADAADYVTSLNEELPVARYNDVFALAEIIDEARTSEWLSPTELTERDGYPQPVLKKNPNTAYLKIVEATLAEILADWAKDIPPAPRLGLRDAFKAMYERTRARWERLRARPDVAGASRLAEQSL